MGLLVVSFILFLSFFTSNSADSIAHYCNRDIAYPSYIPPNLKTLLANLVKKTIQNGYYSSSYGKESDKVYGLAQCRADVSRRDCSNCIQNAARRIQVLCPNQEDALIWYEDCLLRHDTFNFIGLLSTSFSVYYTNVKNITNPRGFHNELRSLVNDVRGQAIVSANHGFGKGKRKLSNSITLYAFAQCDRDLKPENCGQCLDFAVDVGFSGYCRERDVEFCIKVVMLDMRFILSIFLLSLTKLWFLFENNHVSELGQTTVINEFD